MSLLFKAPHTSQPQGAVSLDAAELAKLGIVSGFIATRGTLNEILPIYYHADQASFVEGVYQNGIARAFGDVGTAQSSAAIPTLGVNTRSFTFWTRFRANVNAGAPGLYARSSTSQSSATLASGTFIPLWKNGTNFDMRVGGTDYAADGTWNLGQWYDIKIVGDSTSCKLYVDDVLVINGAVAASSAIEAYLHFGDVSGGGVKAGDFDIQGAFIANKPWLPGKFNPWQLFKPQARALWIPGAVAGGGASTITSASGTSTTGTLSGSSTAASTLTAAAGVSTASVITASAAVTSTITAAAGVSTASALTGSSSTLSSATITAASGLTTASTITARSTAATAPTAAAGTSTAGSLAGVGLTAGASSISAAAGTSTASTLTGSAIASSTITSAAGTSTAGTLTGSAALNIAAGSMAPASSTTSASVFAASAVAASVAIAAAGASAAAVMASNGTAPDYIPAIDSFDVPVGSYAFTVPVGEYAFTVPADNHSF